MRFAAAACCAAALATACHRAPSPAAMPTPAPARTAAGPTTGPTLYDRLGGRDAIRSVVGDFVVRVVGDARINAFFRGVDADDLQTKLSDQICEATGGPCRYTGRSMREAHADLGIGNAEFDALVADLAASLDHFNVGAGEKAELLNILGGLRRQIVTRR